MPSSNILLFDANKANMMADEQYNTNTQRLNGVQSGIASSQLQNKALYQVSLVAYAIAQIMNQNGRDANDTAAVSAFVANLSGTMLQKVVDLATTQQAQAGVATDKWMSPALVKTAINALAAKAQNILSTETKTAFGLGSTAVPDDVFEILSKAVLSTSDGDIKLPSGDSVPGIPKLVYGSYVGDDSFTARVHTTGLPYFLIVCGPGGGGTYSGDYTSLIVCRNASSYRSMSGPSDVAVDVQSIVWTDSQVRWTGVGNTGRTLNRGGQTYHYVYAV